MLSGSPQFVVKAVCKDARHGLLRVASQMLETPAFIVPTSKAAVPYAIPDHIRDQIQPSLVQLYIADICDKHTTKNLAAFPDGATSLFRLPCPAVLVQRPSAALVPPPVTAAGPTFDTISGRITVQPSAFCSFVAALRPAIAVAPADFALTGSTKRAKTALTRTSAWLDAVLNDSQATGGGTAVYATVCGSNSEQVRESCAQSVGRPAVAGFALMFHLGEDAATRADLLAAAHTVLPQDKPRLTLANSLIDVLVSISNGVDLISSSYPIDLAERGTALLLSAQDILRKALTASTATAAAAASTGAAGQAPAADTEPRPHVQLLNMRDASQAENQTPLSRHCQCFGCQRHTAAYMHHLTMTHEMLGDSLLTEHNLWQMQELFSCARQAIAVGAWPHFVAAFAEAMAPPPEETL